MPTPDEVGLQETVLARIPLYPGQELRLRRRIVAEPSVPVFFDLAQYGQEEDQYYLCTPFRADVLDQLIEALVAARETL